MPNCMSLQYGFPCVCEECREEAERRKTICDICKVSPTLRIVSAKYVGTEFGKDMIYRTFTSLCRQCYYKYLEVEASKEQVRNQERDLKRRQELALGKEKLEKMLEGVRAIQSLEQIPIAYALDRLMAQLCSRWSRSVRLLFHKTLRRSLSEDLQIEKGRGRYKCNKERVDAIDFKLWYQWRGHVEYHSVFWKQV